VLDSETTPRGKSNNLGGTREDVQQEVDSIVIAKRSVKYSQGNENLVAPSGKSTESEIGIRDRADEGRRKIKRPSGNKAYWLGVSRGDTRAVAQGRGKKKRRYKPGHPTRTARQRRRTWVHMACPRYVDMKVHGAGPARSRPCESGSGVSRF